MRKFLLVAVVLTAPGCFFSMGWAGDFVTDGGVLVITDEALWLHPEEAAVMEGALLQAVDPGVEQLARGCLPRFEVRLKPGAWRCLGDDAPLCSAHGRTAPAADGAIHLEAAGAWCQYDSGYLDALASGLALCADPSLKDSATRLALVKDVRAKLRPRCLVP